MFVLSMGAALPLVGRSLSLAIATQLVIQTTGLLWLCVSALRTRMREEEAGDDGEGQGS